MSRPLRTARPLLSIAAVWLLAAIACAAVLVTAPQHPEAVRAENAAGDAVCLSCHRQHAAFEETAHRLTSRLPTGASIAGSFRPGENVLRTANPDLHFRMDSTATGFYQTAVTGRAPDTSSRTERFAYVIGSGRKGQSYLYWGSGDRLYQLPVSYWTGLRTWINSPGYPDGRVNFDRPVAPRCLECHATRFESVPALQASNQYRPASAMLGISCETCHGAGQAHVARERSPLRGLLRAAVPRAIVNPARLSRARQLDQCALCHGGLGTSRTAAFSYVPGQPLESHLALQPALPSATVDVHGNQVGLLERSACFQASQMTCATCHDVHRTQRDVVALSGRCLSCHTVQSCGLYPRHGRALLGRCVNCHMPALPSNTIVSDHEGRREQPLVRTHWIKVYPQDTVP
ncbi:MAG TPA: multiheme c-type cytochrome [Gemmatimonadaceae bacterium]|nr:multiheme c-type cytochrome [Gemmatimonadaceae bacterium]